MKIAYDYSARTGGDKDGFIHRRMTTDWTDAGRLATESTHRSAKPAPERANNPAEP